MSLQPESLLKIDERARIIVNNLKSSIEPDAEGFRDIVHLIKDLLEDRQKQARLYKNAVQGRMEFRDAFRKLKAEMEKQALK